MSNELRITLIDIQQLISFLLSLLLLGACQQDTANQPSTEVKEKEVSVVSKDRQPAAYSLNGKPLYAATPSEKLLDKYEKHKTNYESNPSADNLIWYGRFVAYQGKYEEAIQIYSKGIEKYPNDARMYRHRGHRYISIRKFDEAIQDFDKAVTLILGKPNEIEPDGMPNAQNIPVSTLHGNIYYHLGLAHYLNHNFEEALAAYQKCLATGNNPDNVVSATHWLYMILRRLNRTEEAEKVLTNIKLEMPIIENMAYHKANLLYKGIYKPIDLLQKEGEDSPSNDALDYGIANWYFYNGDKPKAKALLEKILVKESWASFGYIAAEKDYKIHFKEN